MALDCFARRSWFQPWGAIGLRSPFQKFDLPNFDIPRAHERHRPSVIHLLRAVRDIRLFCDDRRRILE